MAMGGQPKPGDQAIYTPLKGEAYGLYARGSPIAPEMAKLDLTAGTLVTVDSLDISPPNWPIVSWTDLVGNPRLTAINIGLWHSSFSPPPPPGA